VVCRGFGFGECCTAWADFLDDLVDRLLPHERLGVVVPVFGPQLDRFGEVGDAGERAAA